MGLIGLPIICQRLVAHGVTPDTPIALVEQGTTRQQRVFTATLESMVEKIEGQDIHAPTLIIVGSVVSLHESLRWYQPA